MRHIIFTLVSLLASASGASGQQNEPTFQQLFPANQQRHMGLHKLNMHEQEALRQQVVRLLVMMQQQPVAAPAQQQRAGGGQRAYSGAADGHWIKKNIDDGSYLLLEDGSFWEVDSLDRIDANLWLTTSNITVLESAASVGGYMLVNTDDGEKVGARYVGRR